MRPLTLPQNEFLPIKLEGPHNDEAISKKPNSNIGDPNIAKSILLFVGMLGVALGIFYVGLRQINHYRPISGGILIWGGCLTIFFGLYLLGAN